MIAILIADNIGTFVIVTVLVCLFTNLDLHFALILGALVSATAPAATADVLWEYKSSGPLTQAVLFILAVDDIISILLVQITTNIAMSQVTGTKLDFISISISFLHEIGVAVILGLVFGLAIVWGINHLKSHAEILELILGSLVLVIGTSSLLGTSSIAAAMVFGIIIVSFAKNDPSDVFHDIFKIGSPIVAVFFIVVGLGMRFTDLLFIGVLGAVYLIGRTTGKVGAVGITARAVKAKPNIQKYLGLCLFSQAGVDNRLIIPGQIWTFFQQTRVEIRVEPY